MAQLTDEYMDEKLPPEFDQEFPNAPKNWSPEQARKIARDEGIELQEVHWRVIHLIQDYYREHPAEHITMPRLREMLHQAFAEQGGDKYLYTVFPEGPVNQGCRLAGIEPPPGAVDQGFGSGA